MSANILLDLNNIDYKATAQNAKRFLDFKLPRLLRIANENPASLKSPTISDTAVIHDTKNHNEDQLIKYIEVKDILQGVAKAFKNCSQTSFEILKYKYIQRMLDWQIEDMMYCSKATYFKLRARAYNEFADCFELQKGCEDLHVYR